MDLKKARLDNLQRQLDRLDCDHPKKEIRKRGPHFCWQCLRCGVVVGQWIGHDKVLGKEKVLPFDETIHAKYVANLRQYRHEFGTLKRELEKTDFDAWYSEYLKSPEWKQKSAAVLDRCNHICEGCRKRPAVLAHHKAYTNVGNEFLFELIGLCKQCHDSIHSVQQAQGSPTPVGEDHVY